MADKHQVAEQVFVGPISQIHFPWEWNARARPTVIEEKSGRRVIPSTAPDQEKVGEGGFGGMYESIRIEGQKTALVVRPNPDLKTKTKQPYSCVEGFSRGDAIMMIGEIGGDKDPQVRFIVRDLSEAEARKANLRENTARTTLTAPDLLYGIQKLRALTPDMTTVAIAQATGKSQPFVSLLCGIADRSPQLLEKWRGSLVHVDTHTMHKISKLEGAEVQNKAFEEALRGKPVPQRGGRDKWIDPACTKARALGVRLGNAHRDEFIVADKRALCTEAGVRCIFKFKLPPEKVTGYRGKQLAEAEADKRLRSQQEKHAKSTLEVLAAFKEGFQEGLKKEVEVEEEPEKVKGKKTNGEARA